MASSLEGKVAKILDERTLIINLGQVQGVRNGMHFLVCAKGDDVTDPDTGESLGQWEAVKGRVVATHTQEKLTICAAVADEADDDSADPSTRTLSAAMIADHMPRDGDGAALNVDRSQIDGMPKVGPIAVGDSVRAAHP